MEYVLPLANMDALGDVSEEYIHENIEMVETEPFNDQLDNQGLGSQL
jgi:hypothetical protein